MSTSINCEISQSKVSIKTPEGWNKDITPQAFMELMSKYYSEGTSGGGGISYDLPRNVIRFESSPGRLVLTTYHHECRKPASHNSGWEGEIAVPNIVIRYELSKEEVGGESFWKLDAEHHSATRLSLAAVRSKKGRLMFQDQAELFRLPLPNVYSSGNLCYGGNAMTRRFKLDQLGGLDYYYDFLFLSPFNNDLNVPVSWGGLEEDDEDDDDDGERTSRCSPLDWLKYLATLDKFNYDHLC